NKTVIIVVSSALGRSPRLLTFSASHPSRRAQHLAGCTFAGFERSLHPPHPRRGVFPREVNPALRTGDFGHERTHLARAKHGERPPRPRLAAPTIGDSLFKVQGQFWKCLSHDVLAEGHTLLVTHLGRQAAGFPSSCRPENAARRGDIV